MKMIKIIVDSCASDYAFKTLRAGALVRRNGLSELNSLIVSETTSL